MVEPTTVTVEHDKLPYVMCAKCHHFVDEEPAAESGYIHLEDGDQEFDHAPEPSYAAHTLQEWKQLHPGLFEEYPDGKIGPNSAYYSRRGKAQ